MIRPSMALFTVMLVLVGCGSSSSPPPPAKGTIEFGRSLSGHTVGDITTSFKKGDTLYLAAHFTRASDQYELELQDPNTCSGFPPMAQAEIRQVATTIYTRDKPYTIDTSGDIVCSGVWSAEIHDTGDSRVLAMGRFTVQL